MYLWMCISWLQSSQLTILVSYNNIILFRGARSKVYFVDYWRMTLIWFNSELDFENQVIKNNRAACDSKWVWCVIGPVLLYLMCQKLGLVGPGLHRSHKMLQVGTEIRSNSTCLLYLCESCAFVSPDESCSYYWQCLLCLGVLSCKECVISNIAIF